MNTDSELAEAIFQALNAKGAGLGNFSIFLIEKVLDAHLSAPCLWSQDEDGSFDTVCGHKHEFIDGNIAENNYHFCPFCGGKIQEAQ